MDTVSLKIKMGSHQHHRCHIILKTTLVCHQHRRCCITLKTTTASHQHHRCHTTLKATLASHQHHQSHITPKATLAATSITKTVPPPRQPWLPPASPKPYHPQGNPGQPPASPKPYHPQGNPGCHQHHQSHTAPRQPWPATSTADTTCMILKTMPSANPSITHPASETDNPGGGLSIIWPWSKPTSTCLVHQLACIAFPNFWTGALTSICHKFYRKRVEPNFG